MQRPAVSAVVWLATVVGCSSSTSPAPGAGAQADGGAGARDADTADTGVASNNCVKPGTTGNEKGVGAYCDAVTSCPSFAATNTFLVCTYGHAPPNEVFCTTPCGSDKECGTNAYCAFDTGGNGCVPFACGSPPDAAAGDAAPE